MGKLLVIGVLLLLVGCGDAVAPAAAAPTMSRAGVTSVPASAPVVIGTAAPTTASLSVADTSLLATLVAAATLADGSLAQTGSLHTAYQNGTAALPDINAGSSAEIQMLSGTLGPLLTGEDQVPSAWRCADGLTINAVYLAMATAGQVTDDSGKDQAYQQDATATHIVAQAALLTAQRVVHQQPAVPLTPDVLTANQAVATAYGHRVVCP